MKEEQSKQDVRALFHFFSRNIREQLLALPLEADGMEEVRLRVSAPLYYIYKNKTVLMTVLFSKYLLIYRFVFFRCFS